MDVGEMIVTRLMELQMYEAAMEVVKLTTNDKLMIEELDGLIKGINDDDDIKEQHIGFIKDTYFNEANETESVEIMTLKFHMDNNEKILFAEGFDEFNKGNYNEALKIFNVLNNNPNESSKAFILIYLCLCQYKLEEYTGALKTINNAIFIEGYNENLYKIRDQIIDRLEIIESKNKFVEEYYSTGTYMGEIVKRSLELYHRLDNIEVKNKNLLKKIPAYLTEVKKIYSQEKKNLERDLINADELIKNAEKGLKFFLNNEENKRTADSIERFNLSTDVYKVLRAAELSYLSKENDSELDYSYIVFSYCKAVEMLCREKLLKYFMENRAALPNVNSRSDYHKLGISSFDADGIIRYSFKSDYNIQSSEYLLEINKHVSLRKQFKGKEHTMPWDKLKFINHCIKTGKDPVDGTKSAGIIILFYCAYRNYLGLKSSYTTRDGLVNLAGNLIRLQNERNLLMHSKVLNNRDNIYKIREITFDCIEKLCNIE